MDSSWCSSSAEPEDIGFNAGCRVLESVLLICAVNGMHAMPGSVCSVEKQCSDEQQSVKQVASCELSVLLSVQFAFLILLVRHEPSLNAQ